MTHKHDVETGYFLQPDTVVLGTAAVPGSGPRNSDGLLIPSTKLFGILLAIYKIIVILTSILIVVAIIVLIIFQVGADTLEKAEMKKEEKEKLEQNIALLHRLMPVLITGIVFSAIHNVIAWIAIKTLRLKYLKMDLYLQIFFLVVWFVAMLQVEQYSDALTALIAELVEIGLVYGIIREIRLANNV